MYVSVVIFHILKKGYSLCRFPVRLRPEIPARWPVGHTYVDYKFQRWDRVNCDDCLKEVPPEKTVLLCPACGKQHLDVGEFATKVHRTHLCVDTPEGPNTGCGHLWRPKNTPTFGVQKA